MSYHAQTQWQAAIRDADQEGWRLVVPDFVAGMGAGALFVAGMVLAIILMGG